MPSLLRLHFSHLRTISQSLLPCYLLQLNVYAAWGLTVGLAPHTHPCTCEGPCPVVNFVMNVHRGSILSYTINFNSHGKACLNRSFYKRKKFSVRDHARHITPTKVPSGLCNDLGARKTQKARKVLRPHWPQYIWKSLNCPANKAFPLDSNPRPRGSMSKPALQIHQFHFHFTHKKTDG